MHVNVCTHGCLAKICKEKHERHRTRDKGKGSLKKRREEKKKGSYFIKMNTMYYGFCRHMLLGKKHCTVFKWKATKKLILFFSPPPIRIEQLCQWKNYSKQTWRQEWEVIQKRRGCIRSGKRRQFPLSAVSSKKNIYYRAPKKWLPWNVGEKRSHLAAACCLHPSLHNIAGKTRTQNFARAQSDSAAHCVMRDAGVKHVAANSPSPLIITW